MIVILNLSTFTSLTQTMTRSLIASYIFIAGVIITVGTQLSVQKLEAATATQCMQHDWPVKAHQVHMAWCAANNYKTN
jgi:ABC-type glucose/galactose transport system permease subunit